MSQRSGSNQQSQSNRCGISEEEIAVKVQRVIRKQKYKKLLDQGAELNAKADTTDFTETLEGVLRIIEETNVLQSQGRIKDRAENATEVLMDAQVIKLSHEIMGAAVLRMGHSEFSDDEFAHILNLTMEDDNMPLKMLTKRAIKVISRTKFRISMLGTLKESSELTQKIAKQRQQRQKANLGQAKKPVTVDKLKKQEKGAQKLNLILKQITEVYQQRRRPIPYFEMITDPDDFMTTVDNAFQISFLVRDGTVALEHNEDNGEVYVRPSSAQEKKQVLEMPESVQAILGLNMGKWRNMIAKYGIVEPLLLINREDFSTQQDETTFMEEDESMDTD